MPTNGIVFRGQLLQRETIRISPTGVPVLECTLWHESTQQEAEASRRLAFACPARVLGPLALRLAKESPDDWLLLKGFMAPRRGACANKPLPGERVTSGLIFHITEYELENHHGI
ncbi:MAG: primosomal replication protein [Pseudomonadota bacterium]|jgi:primosomal replication protein N